MSVRAACPVMGGAVVVVVRDVAAELYRLGFVNERGAVFSASSVQSMLE